MKNRLSFVILTFLEAFFAAALFFFPADVLAKEEAPPQKIYLEKFTPQPLGSTSALKMADLKNRVVLIDFWASWCAPCKEALPHYNKLHQQYKDQGLIVLGINEDDSAKERDDFLKTMPLLFGVYTDPNREFSKIFHVEALPSSFLINKRGQVVLSLRGLTKKNMQMLDEKIKALLKEPSL